MQRDALFLFDIDGTLLRAATAVHRAAFAHAFRTVYGLPLDLDGISAAGRTDTWLLAETLRRAGVSETDSRAHMADAFSVLSAYVEHHLGDLRARVLPGVPKVLDELQERGELLGLLTGNISRVAVAKMRQAGLEQYFDTGGFGEESEIRAHLVPVALARTEELRGRAMSPGRTVVIGDTPFDVEAGKIAGTLTAGVATGSCSEDVLRQTGADLVLPSFADAPAATRALLSLVS